MEQRQPDDTAARLDSIEAVLARMDRRLARLENIEGVSDWEPSEQAAAMEGVVAPEPEDIKFDFTLIGRSFFALAGAYLLRAATESGVLPLIVGVVLGLVYALSFIVLAWRAVSRGARPSASFHGGIALLIAFPLIAEAVIHFELIGPVLTAALISLVAGASFIVCFLHRMKSLSWLTTLSTLATLVVVMMRTHEMLPNLWVLLALVATTSQLARVTGQHLVWPVAIVGDILVLAVAEIHLAGRGNHSSEAILFYFATFFLVFAGGALTRTIRERDDTRASEMFQVAVATLCTFGSGARIAAAGADGAAAFQVLALVSGGIIAIMSLRVFETGDVLGRNARYWTTVGVLLTLGAFSMFTSGVVLATLATLVAVILLFAARHLFGGFLELHAVIALGLATWASSLGGHALRAIASSPEVFTPIDLPALALLPLTLAVAVVVREARPESHWEGQTAKVIAILLAVFCGVGVLVTFFVDATSATRGGVAAIRTAVLVTGVILLAALSRLPRLRSARVLVYPGLVLAAAKLLFEDFRVGSPATLFLALALYGAALIFAPRLRWKEPEPEEQSETPS